MDENPDFDEFGLEYSCEIGGMFDDEVLDDVGDDFDEEVGEVSEDVREDVGTAKDGELLFMSFEAVDAALGNAFLGGGQEEANKIFKSLPYPLLKKVIGKAFQQNPWCGSERLVYITEDGVSVPISYLFFYRNVGGRFLARAYHAAKSAQVATYRGACEFMQLSTRKFGSEGGFNLVKRWLPRLVRESFAEKPFVPLHQMMLYRNGVPLRKITSFLAHKFCTDELQAKLVDVYEEAERDYLAESIDHVLEYMAEVKNFQWSKVPMYYHQVLLEMAFEDAPFKGGQHLKLDRPGGDRIGSLYYYYYLNSRKKLKKDDPPNGLMDFFNAMYNEVFEDYLSDINKVLDFIFSPEFREKGKGWNMVPEKWHKVFITNAVFQSDEENPRRTNLVCKYEGKGVLLLKILYARYMKNGRGAEFKSIYDDAVEMKKRMKAEMAESGEVKDSRFVAKNRKNKDGEGVVGVERDLKKKKRDRKLAVATNLSMSAEERIAGELYPRLPDEEILRNLMREA
ncbi:hypothetical protein HOE67_00455, partial [Candidatus Peregrinibacteria bacterium]|nr:hypothetical protein [Candidatus Peregrinibacteria bacterium]